MNELFNKCIPIVIKNEVGGDPNGGYTDDPDDSGGETKWGISKQANSNLDIKNLTLDQAREIYYNKYWLPLKLEGIVNENSALQIFDFAVNAGLKRAVMTAQRLAGVYVDGKMGPNTIAAINNMDRVFLGRYIHARREYYTYLAKAKPKLSKFLNGWLRRVEYTKIYV
jgi:lysozyme family protein